MAHGIETTLLTREKLFKDHAPALPGKGALHAHASRRGMTSGIRAEPQGAAYSAAQLCIGTLLAIAVIATPASLCHAHAQDEPNGQTNTAQADVPLPPVRPNDFPSVVPAPPPDVPAKSLPSRDPSPGDSSSTLSPYRVHTLPPTTRARMHECGVEWQRMKSAGATAEKTWYTFAQTCLAQ